MPDYLDPTQPQVQQPYMPQIPAPAQQMQDYSYLYQNQNIVWQQQNSVANTLRTAQWNMQQHMQNVLAGTMAASMALYQTGHNVTAIGHEHKYGDTLFPGGKYVLERSMWRDTMWATGIAQSDFGRALKIGGRKPEWLSDAEYAYQQSRSTHLRMEELTDMGIGALSSIPGMTVGMMTPGVGWAIGIGLAADALSGFAVKKHFAYRKHSRNLRHMTEMTDMNRGMGQRRMDDQTTSQLADYLFEQDNNLKTFIPLFGDRFQKDTLQTDVFKKMTSLGMFRDNDLKDLEGIKKSIKDTTEYIEKYAGILNMTKDEVLKVTASFQKMGLTNIQRTGAMDAVAYTKYVSGIDANTLFQHGQQFAFQGKMLGYNSNVSMREGLGQISQFSALQNAGVISQMYDPATLAAQAVQGAQAFGETGFGKVAQFGNGSVGMTMDYFRGIGGGSVIHGYVLDALGIVEREGGSIAGVKKALEFAKRKGGRDMVDGLLFRFKQQGIIQSGAMATKLYNEVMGGMDTDKIADTQAALDRIERYGGKGFSSTASVSIADLARMKGGEAYTGPASAITGYNERDRTSVVLAGEYLQDITGYKAPSTKEDLYKKLYEKENVQSAIDELYSYINSGNKVLADQARANLEKITGEKEFYRYGLSRADEEGESRRHWYNAKGWLTGDFYTKRKTIAEIAEREKSKAGKVGWGKLAGMVTKDRESWFGKANEKMASNQRIQGILSKDPEQLKSWIARIQSGDSKVYEEIASKTGYSVESIWDAFSERTDLSLSESTIRKAVSLAAGNVFGKEDIASSTSSRIFEGIYATGDKKRFKKLGFNSAQELLQATMNVSGVASAFVSASKAGGREVNPHQYNKAIEQFFVNGKFNEDFFEKVARPYRAIYGDSSVDAVKHGIKSRDTGIAQSAITLFGSDITNLTDKERKDAKGKAVSDALDQAALNDKALANLADACGKLVTLLS